MVSVQAETDSKPTWFVGASGDEGDQTPRFLAEGIWENGYADRHLDLVRSMRPGERIAIKAAYTRKRGLPFDNRGQAVAVMAIKAIGTITENMNDGRHVRVRWTAVDPVREWYFTTHRQTIWRVESGDWTSDNLIAFTFDNKPQDIDRFRNAPYWRERFGGQQPGERRFAWTKFYQAVADKLLTFRNDRRALIDGLRVLADQMDGFEYLAKDQFADGRSGFLRDICPFTVMGLFNRNIRTDSRRLLAAELAKFLGVTEPVPESFEGIPLLNNMKSWLFPREKIREADHIDSLWAVFAAAVEFADSESYEARATFAAAFDDAIRRRIVGWNLTFGLYWSRPWAFASLDANSQQYITRKLGVPIGKHGPKGRCSASDYLAVIETLDKRFSEPSYPVHSFPELSLAAWQYRDPADTSDAISEIPPDTQDDDEDGESEEAISVQKSVVPYGIDDLIVEGCFLERPEISRILDRIRSKKNLILQGPPGTGKSWLARRLGFALVGHKDDSKVRAVQFHPNLSYEDFVRGWRPKGDGQLSLEDGIFLDMIHAAIETPSDDFVIVIEEINRGNPAQVFGELLTLMEAGKREPSEALELSYRRSRGERVHVPRNLFVIGTMNVADRSLALVDLALRRRFAFVDLEPRFGTSWQNWVTTTCGVDPGLVTDLERRIRELNEAIAADARLGAQFRIGHSYVTPSEPIEPARTRDWFTQVVETEIGPLLDEYWFDAAGEARRARDRLLKDW